MASLTLPEEVLLLALCDDKGTTHSGVYQGVALGAAVLSELLLQGRVRTVKGPKDSLLVEATDESAAPLSLDVFDEALQLVRNSSKTRAVGHWVSKFSSLKELRHRIALSLVRRGTLRMDEDKVLFLFTRKVYPELDPRPEREILERLGRALHSDSEPVEARTAILLSLSHATGLLKANFDATELKGRKQRLDEILNGNAVGDSARKAVEEAQMAVFVACIMPAVITPVIISH